jgi:hypothetical protein
MKKILFPAFLMLIVVVFACKKQDNLPNTTPNGNIATLAFEECTTFSNFSDLNICFKKIKDDHCPCNIDCIWAGAAEVTLHITKTGLDSTVMLFDNTLQGTDMDSSIVIGTETIVLKSVKVDDFCNNQGKSEKYTIEIEVKN